MQFSNSGMAKHSGTKYWLIAIIYRPNASPLHQIYIAVAKAIRMF